MKHAFGLMLVICFLLAVPIAFGADARGGKAWRMDVFGKELVDAQGRTVSPDILKGKIVALYFSAHWCRPCREFTPVLVRTLNELKEKGRRIEVVFVSCDSDAEAMREYMQGSRMPWLAIPYASDKREATSARYEVMSIPTLLVFGPDGKVLTRDGRQDVASLGVRAYRKWLRMYQDKYQRTARGAAPAAR